MEDKDGRAALDREKMKQGIYQKMDKLSEAMDILAVEAARISKKYEKLKSQLLALDINEDDFPPETEF